MGGCDPDNHEPPKEKPDEIPELPGDPDVYLTETTLGTVDGVDNPGTKHVKEYKSITASHFVNRDKHLRTVGTSRNTNTSAMVIYSAVPRDGKLYGIKNTTETVKEKGTLARTHKHQKPGQHTHNQQSRIYEEPRSDRPRDR